MNFLTTRGYDKFSESAITTTLTFENYPTIFVFKHTSNQEGEHVFIEVSTKHDDGYMYLNRGELIFNINNTKNIKLKPIDTAIKRDYIGYWDIATYLISKEQLLLLCNAETITYRLSGDHNSEEGSDTRFEIDGCVMIDGKKYYCCDIKIQLGAQALYNAVYDETAFINELKQEQNRIIQEDIERNKLHEEREKLKKEKKNLEDRKDNLETAIGLIAVIGYPSAVVVGGIWSFLEESWAPFIGFIIIVTAIVVLLAIIQKHTKQELEKEEYHYLW